MSKNTNTLFWVITGAVIVISLFLIINSFNNDSIKKATGKISSVFQNTVKKSDEEELNNPTNIKKYYGHNENWDSIEVESTTLFEFDEKTGTVLKYNGNSSIVEIPNGIEYISCRAFDIDKTYPTGISPLLIQNDSERNYFQANPNISIKKIIFPDSVKEFEVGAVSNLPNLEEVVLPRGITELPKLVLTNCPKLKKITTFTKKINISHSNLENSPECLDKEIIYHGIRLKINLTKYKYNDHSNKDQVTSSSKIVHLDTVGVIVKYIYFENPLYSKILAKIILSTSEDKLYSNIYNKYCLYVK